MAKVSKEQAMQIYNRYNQIELTKNLIKDLSEMMNKVSVKKPDIIDNRYHPYGTIELRVPEFEKGEFRGGYRIYGISYPSALKVLKNHIKQLQRELKEIQDNL